MDYEKAYKEALNWMRSIYPTLTGSDKEDAEHYFPELRESEDERIRKEIMNFILHKAGALIDEDTEHRYIAYLEKQKEQKHPNGCFTCDEYKKGYEEGRRNGFTAGYNKAMKEVEQKEQKPVEWSEEDEKDVAHIIRVLDDCYAYGKHDLSKTDHDNLTSTIKSIRSCPKASDNRKPKYIDADRLKEEIKHLKIDVYDESHQFDLGARSSLTFLESFIDSLTQEQPEVDLKKEVDKFLNETGAPYFWCKMQERRKANEIH